MLVLSLRPRSSGHRDALGVPTATYLPYCFFNLINPIVSLIYGITIKHIPPDEEEAAADADQLERAKVAAKISR